MSLEIFLDIETLPCADPDLIAELTSGIRPPGSMKRADTIAKWEAEERPQAVADAIARTSLDGAYGRVCAIGWAVGDDDPKVLVGPEREVLDAFLGEVQLVLQPEDGRPQVAKWIGHNLAGFDLPFLRKRCVIHGLRPPLQLLDAMHFRPWNEAIADTMLMWDSDRDKRISLDRLCKVLSIPSPKADGIDGSQVAALFAAGEYERLGEYCSADVVAARRCYRALTFS
jgi:predicted PolB exonuclease-like 3'-5' exonuclease